MLKITEQTPHRLTLKDQRPAAGFVAAIFTLFSVLSLLALFVQGVETLILVRQRDYLALRITGFILFLLIGCGLALIGVGAVVHFWRGVICIFDKQAETMTLSHAGFFRRRVLSHPIYAISHLDVEKNDDVRSYGLFIVLRSGERIPIAAFPLIDQAHVETLVKQVRGFLRS